LHGGAAAPTLSRHAAEEMQMPELHARGVILVVELLEAADHVARYKPEDVSALLRETAEVLGELLKRDIPAHRRT